MNRRFYITRKTRLVLVCLAYTAILLAMLAGPAQAQVDKYVDINAAVSGDGSAATPWKYLFDALDPTTGIGDDTILHIAAGTYNVAAGEPAGNRTVSKNNVVVLGLGSGVTILEGTAGHSWTAGLTITGDNVSVRNVTIKHFEDGLVIDSVNTSEISDNEIYDNGTVATGHGGIVVTDSDNVSIHNNSIYWSGDANFIQTDGIRATDSAAPYDLDVYVASNTIQGHNHSGSSGVSIYDCYTIFRYNNIYQNETGIYAGAMGATSWLTPQIERNFFTDNKTGIHIATSAVSTGASPIIFNNQINDNGSDVAQTGIHLDNSGGTFLGATIQINTFADLTGNGLQVTGAVDTGTTIFGNIIANCDQYGIYSNTSVTLSSMTDNDLYNNLSGNYFNVTPGTGNISADPKFALTTDYHLTWESPCLDTISIPGITQDLDGTGRPVGPPPTPLSDMGCYETPWHSVTTSVTPTGSGTVTAPDGGYYKETVNVQAAPNSGYTFVEWQGDLTSTSATETLFMDGNKTIQAVFSSGPVTYTLNTTVVPAGAGSVLGGGSYADGETATIQAVPASGWLFQDWSGDVTGNQNPATVVMDMSKSVTANFMTDASYTVDFTGSRSAADYRMVSLAVQHPYASAANVLGLPGGSYDRTTMRIGTWDPGTQSYIEYPFGALQVKPGWAGWFLFANNSTLKVTGTTVPLSPAPPSIGGDPGITMPSMAQGWNQIGNPFRHDIFAANIYMLTATPQSVDFYVYENGSYYIATGGVAIDQGGWFYNDSGGPVDVFIQSTTYSPDPSIAHLSSTGLRPLTSDDRQPPDPPSDISSSSSSASGSGDGGGGGGCFIGTAQEASHRSGLPLAWTVVGLILLLGLAWFGLRP